MITNIYIIATEMVQNSLVVIVLIACLQKILVVYIQIYVIKCVKSKIFLKFINHLLIYQNLGRLNNERSKRIPNNNAITINAIFKASIT